VAKIIVSIEDDNRFILEHEGIESENKEETFVDLDNLENALTRLVKKIKENILKGGYFQLCQFCEHDGQCILLHHEFMGVEPGDGVSKIPYPGHENLKWHFSVFQKGTMRSKCTGRILPTDNIFLPLSCECGTAINDSMCEKFKPNEKGKRRIKLTEEVAEKKGIDKSDVCPEDLPELPFYRSIMK